MRLLAWICAASILCGHPMAHGDPAKGDAARIYRRGVELYERGEYDEAIELFQRAYSLTHAPLLLFDIAQSYRRKGARTCDKAQEYYELYLRKNPHPVNQSEAED